MPIFVERYVLPLLVGVTLILVFTNPMHWGGIVRIAGCLLVIGTALTLGIVFHRRNRASEHQVGKQEGKPQPPRIMVPSGVTPQQLIGIFRDEKYTHDQAVRMTEPCMGKWMRFTGTINDIAANIVFLNDTENRPAGIVLCANFGKDWHERVAMLQRRMPVSIEGRVRRINEMNVTLQDCEIVESK
jgi:hypothetical protein